MTFEEFDMAMMRPVFIYRMAHAMAQDVRRNPFASKQSGAHASAIIRETNAMREIDKLVLERAETIRTELES